MDMTEIQHALNASDVSSAMYRMIEELYPICRSITGNGVRQTLHGIRRHIPIEIHEVPSGTQVFDWRVPLEWNIRDAYIAAPDGTRVVDFRQCNLHVMSYSVPIKSRMSLKDLQEHLHTLPDRPEWIPYRTSYYKDNWGFCLSHNQLKQLPDTDYEVCIDSSLEPGHLTYGECFLPGESAEEVLISTHICHPSLCNDNLSGVAVSAFLCRALQSMQHKLSYRFLFVPGTIGSITWLAMNQEHTSWIRHGLVLTGVGDTGPITYKRSRRKEAKVDLATIHVLQYSNEPHKSIEFFPIWV